MGELKSGTLLLPRLKLDHLFRLTDDTGILQHSLYSVPRATFGYCVDDNARALLVALRLYSHWRIGPALALAYRYLAFMEQAQREDGRFHNFMGYDRRWLDDVASEDAMGRALWALGYAVQFAPEDGLRLASAHLFDRAVTWIESFRYPRAWAYSILGLKHRWHQDGSTRWTNAISQLSHRLVAMYQQQRGEGWHWFEPIMTYANGRLPQALLSSYLATGNQQALDLGLEALNFLNSVCYTDGYIDLVGQRGWFANGSRKAEFDQQPIDAKALAAANATAWQVTAEPQYRDMAYAALEWFMGRNRHGRWLYNPATGGCHDGLTSAGINGNQGAESLLSLFLTYMDVYEIAAPAERDQFGIEASESWDKG